MSTPPFLELPPGVEAVRVPTERGELAALEGRPPGDAHGGRLPVLLVPGFTGSKEDFIAVLPPILAAGHRVLAIDQTGQYESAGEADPTSYDVKALAQDVLSVVRHLGERTHLVGHSFGGLVARAAAVAEPTALASLTLLGSGPGAIPHPAASNLELIVAALPVMDLETIWTYKRQMERPTEVEPPSPAIEEFMHRRFVANSPVALLRHAEQLLSEPDSVDELAAVDLPVLVAFGPDDDAWPASVQGEMARRLGARVAVVDGAGHSPAAQQPTATATALLDFWSSVG